MAAGQYAVSHGKGLKIGACQRIKGGTESPQIKDWCYRTQERWKGF